MSKLNMYANLEEVDTVINIDRKAKKKIREIDSLKLKGNNTPDEIDKINLEKYWLSIIMPNPIIRKNSWNINHSYRTNKIHIDNDCPICMSTIPNHLIVVTNCKHTYCSRCTLSLLANSNRRVCCSLCREAITNYEFSLHNKDDAFEIMRILATKK